LKKILLLFISISLLIEHPVYANRKIERAGDVIQILLPATAYGMSFIYNDQQGRCQFSKSFLSSMGITFGLKFLINKKRPDGGSYSFPSGHTAAAFSGASFIQRRYGWRFGIPAYILASFVGWSRVEAKKHFIEDVLAGAAISVICTYIFTIPYQKNVNGAPIIDQGQYGSIVTVRVSFDFMHLIR